MDYKQYLDEKIHQLRIVSLVQWDYLDYSNFCDWLEDNFQNDLEGQYYATKIILHTLYYKKKDMENLLRYGLYEKIYGEILKSELISKNNIYLSNSEAAALIYQLKQKTFFAPLLDSNKPSESGNIIIGTLVHKLDIKEEQVGFYWDLDEKKLASYKYLIFVDDCVGSGCQLKNFWNSDKIINLREICKKQGIIIYYLVLIGYDKNLEKLKKNKQIEGIEIIVGDLLTDKNRVFSVDSIVWDKTNNEREEAIKYFKKIQKEKGINFLGFQKLDFAVILNDRLPNWSLPIFWKEMAGWKYLLKRKNSV